MATKEIPALAKRHQDFWSGVRKAMEDWPTLFLLVFGIGHVAWNSMTNRWEKTADCLWYPLTKEQEQVLDEQVAMNGVSVFVRVGASRFAPTCELHRATGKWDEPSPDYED